MRLPKNIIPISYDIHIDINMEKYIFGGNVSINAKTKENTKNIYLHSKDLIIRNINIIQNKKNLVNRFKNEKDMIIIQLFDNILVPGNCVIHIEYNGIIGETMEGIYKSKYSNKMKKEEYMIATQFEALSARKVFPCFDEPSFKSVFNLSLSIPKNKTAISNMPVINVITNNNNQIIKFDSTPIMSTYLLAFVIGEFEYVEHITRDNTLIRVYATPNKMHKLDFALDISVKALEWFNDWFGIKYFLPKLDFIAIPDFSAGAMENWGLITFREQTLLYDNTTSIQDKQDIVNTICHEIAHQWFGNLVTMEWWSYLWLNESVATFLAWYATDSLFPEWNIWKRFIDEEHSHALELDSLPSTHSLEVKNLEFTEINQIFDEISYSKGACLIRCLANYIGMDRFKNGMHNYLTKYQYKNTMSSDFWKSFGEDINILMQKWTTTSGYPLICIDKDTTNNIKLTQFKYLSLGSDTQNNLVQNDVWPIPLEICDSGNTTKKYILFDKKYMAIDLEPNLQQIKINHKRTGFFRIKYSKVPNYEIMNVDEITYSIIDMAYLAMSGHDNFLNLIKYILNLPLYEQKYDDYYLWKSLTKYIKKIYGFLLYDNKERDKYYNNVIVPVYHILYDKYIMISNMNTKFDINNDTTKLFYNLCIKNLGLAGHTEIIKIALDKFRNNKWDNNYEILSIVGKYGSANDYNKIISMIDNKNIIHGYYYHCHHDNANYIMNHNHHDHHKNYDDKHNIEPYLEAISRTIRPEIANKNIDLLYTGIIKSQNLCYFIRCLSKNKLTTDKLWDSVTNRWEYFLKKFPEDSSGIQNLVKAMGSGFMTDDQLNKYKLFFNNRPSGTNIVIEQTIEKITHNINIIKKLKNDMKNDIKN